MPEVQPHPDPPSRSREDSCEGSVSAQAAQSVGAAGGWDEGDWDLFEWDEDPAPAEQPSQSKAGRS